VAAQLGFVRDITASNTTFRMCGSAEKVLMAALGGSHDRQLDALLCIKDYIDTTGVLKDWNVDTGVNGGYCDWTGVSCTLCQVDSINIWSGTGITGLKGKLPPASAFQGLNGLTFITIGDQLTGIQGKLPDDWSQLQQLQFLSVANNSLTGSIPSS
jgi:hypothetical protein